MSWFRNLKLGKKIITGYIIISILTLITGYIGIKNVQQLKKLDSELYTNNTKPIAEIGRVSVDFQKTRVNTRDMLSTTEASVIQQKIDQIEVLGNEIDETLVQFEKSIIAQEIRAENDSLIVNLSDYDGIKTQFTSLVLSGQIDEARTLLAAPNSQQVLAAIEENIDNLYDMKVSDAAKKQDQNESIANKAITLIITTLIASVLLSVLLGIVLSRMISRPIVNFSHELDKLSKGNMDIDISSDTKDEIGDLSKSLNDTVEYIRGKAYVADRIAEGDLDVEVYVMSEQDVLSKSILKLVATVKLIISEMTHMAHEHNAGDIDVFIDEDKFEGAYRGVATGINDMIKEHIRAKKETVGCISEFAKGNFDAELEKFPGKKAFINEAVENMRTNLKEVNNEINSLVKAADEGRLSERADVEHYRGDWSHLMKGLNRLIDAILEPINEASMVLEEMSKGNLNTKVVGDYKGDHAKIKNTLNFTISILHDYIEEISDTLRQISDHDLTMTIESEYVGDFSNIKSSLNLIISSLNEVMGEINFAAEQVSAGSSQVSDSSQALSQGSAEQASSVEEITASIEQVAAQTKQNALNANNANELATKAHDEATEGNEQMHEMVKSMEAINESSANISKIIKVIDEIAFQTNLLALNAAVEAARAGEHGKGFAVVAEEVRNLAVRSANAAKETTDMIENSIKTTESGTNIAYGTAKSLEEILQGVLDVSNLVSEIASASNEQATAVSQINQAIDQVSTVTQMNTSTSEESAAASEELSGQAEMLKEMVGAFKLKGKYKSNKKNNKVNQNYSSSTNEQKNSNHREDSNSDNYDKIEISLDDVEFGKYT